MTTALIFDVNEDSFQGKVLQASGERPIMVDFWAEWCPPCHALTPVLERVTASYHGDVLLAKVEVDDNMKLAGRYQLRGFPTVILFYQGREVGRFSGAKPEPFVRDFIEDSLPGHEPPLD